MKIAIGGDHAGYQLKEKLKKYLASTQHTVVDFGPVNEESCDYPDIAHPLAKSIEKEENDLGIVICGSGNGINITVNKHQGIRSVLCWNEELAALGRQHNNANVLALPARYINLETAIKCVDAFLSNDFEGGRHQRRVDKIALK
jgi:ribose 5-phosphate isomerase B